jgi:hypothetical protein
VRNFVPRLTEKPFRWGYQQGRPLVSGEGDEMKVATPGNAFEDFRHKRKRGAHPLHEANRQRRPSDPVPLISF